MASPARSGGLSPGGDEIKWEGNTATVTLQSRIDQQPPPVLSPLQPPADSDIKTLYMGNLERWMDCEYVKQVIRLMSWDRSSTTADTITVKIPPPSSEITPRPNNPGYCFITFPSAAHAARVLVSVNTKDPTSAPLLMPNSTRPFNLQWANPSQLPTESTGTVFEGPSKNTATSNSSTIHHGSVNITSEEEPEFSIFVGDLAPEVSNSDLLALFRNPFLGLRKHLTPIFIRPFLSCKSAKVLQDRVTGLSRGFGFVRFTDEAEQQRALVEMHGLYCLSRPMRVSPATKFTFNPASPMPTQPLSVSFSFINQPPTLGGADGGKGISNDIETNLATSVSSPVAAATSSTTNGNSTISNKAFPLIPALTAGNSGAKSTKGLSSPRDTGSLMSEQSDPTIVPQFLARLADLASNDEPSQDWNATPENHQRQARAGMGSFPSSSSMSIQRPPCSGQTVLGPSGSSILSGSGALSGVNDANNEAWRHQAQGRAIVGDLIGPNGEHFINADPYNTTVFVGGLSSLVSEATLKTFFDPFGDIHYVRVPRGKNCGFVQFVRKEDAGRAIGNMQGFPIGGSNIRVSWGRSQYKAAQAVMKAAQAAQEEQVAPFTVAMNAQNLPSPPITSDEALKLIGRVGDMATPLAPSPIPSEEVPGLSASLPFHNGTVRHRTTFNPSENYEFVDVFLPSKHLQSSKFSPFSNASPGTGKQQQCPTISPPSLPRPSPSHALVFGSGLSVSANYSDPHFPHSSSAESSSRSSSVRFSSNARGSSGFPNAVFLENPSGSFQINDGLLHNSQMIGPHGIPSSSHPQEASVVMTLPRHQQVDNSLHLGDDTSESELIHDLNGTLASLDLTEKYSCAAIGSELLLKTRGDKQSLRKSVSTPLEGFMSPRPKSGSSPDST